METSGEPPAKSASSGSGFSRPLVLGLFGLRVSLSGLQTFVGLTAGILSIGATVFAIPGLLAPAPGKGDLVAIVQEAKTEKAVSDATVEILTTQNAIITTLKPNYFGKARYSLEQGQYRVRVSHARFAAEVRQVQVVAGQTGEIRVHLRAGASSVLRQAEGALDEGVNAVRRLFGK